MNIRPEVNPNRRSGNTTRLVDYYIQEIFNLKEGDFIEIKDHHEHPEAHRYLLKRIKERFNKEHNNFFTNKYNFSEKYNIITKETIEQ